METVVIGMSGGVDSSVAALLLKRQGYNVIGLFMLNWEEEEGGACTAESDYADVRRVCSLLQIPYYSVNFAKEYKERVFSHFLAEYAAGRTPNPDVLCNREIKFGPFREYALSLGADYIATGHYCGIEHAKDGRHYLLKAADAGKDQTYFLNQVTRPQLERVMFPLAKLTKPQVRRIAEENGLATAGKKDSTGICFIGERNFRKFLSGYLPAQPGKILTLDGEEVGEHIGLMHYTLGQRRGVNLGGRRGEEGRWFVVKKDVKNNILYVSHGDESPLYGDSCTVGGLNWIGIDPPEKEFVCTAKFRYRQGEQQVTVIPDGGKVRVVYKEPQRAVTEGQYAVFYDERRCLGGGVILSV